jgi:glycosyltransferase involved in cell wall biosynthesis
MDPSRHRTASPHHHIIGIDASRAARVQRTGTETYSLELTKAITNQVSPPYRLRLYTPYPPQHSDWPNSPQMETCVIAWPRLWTHLRLAIELYRRPPNVLFVPGHVLPLYCPVPAIVTVHDLGYLRYPETHRPFDRWYLNWTTRRHCRVAQHILADSLATKRDLLDFYGADPDRISVVYLGRDETLSPVADPATIVKAKSRYNIKGDYLLYLGTLHPRKNLVRVIDAFHTAVKSLQNEALSLVLAGRRGWMYDKIFERVQRLGLEKQVIFPGYVDEETKPALLSGALAYVFPSLYEGFGLPVLEAMACGVPVLTSNCSSLPEVAGQAALLVNPNSTAEITDGLIQLIANVHLRHQLIEQGYRQVEKFSWRSAATQVLEIVEKIVAGS